MHDPRAGRGRDGGPVLVRRRESGQVDRRLLRLLVVLFVLLAGLVAWVLATAGDREPRHDPPVPCRVATVCD